MEHLHGFELSDSLEITELKTDAKFFRHIKTGAELISLTNNDKNKVFGITFRTPPSDSTGIAHILEHSVLCGSRKYPVKEPFVELLKGSLQTFLNAFTYPDKTCYPVASQNLKDFYNLVDVYLDAVFYPRITPLIFQQEGWHYELEKENDPLTRKGVVFNEMKGAHSSPESILYNSSQHSLFPDNTYSLDSGGDPKKIPDLTYEQFKTFHQNYYHPSNARIYFYGDDDFEKRLELTDHYLKDFSRAKPDSAISLQAPVNKPSKIEKSFPAGTESKEQNKGMVTVNWLLPETCDLKTNMALCMLEYILLGMPASPLRKALIDSGLGDGIAGIGLENELRQMYFSTGLKGVAIKNAGKTENLIIQTIKDLSQNGIDNKTIEAALNTIEFRLKENNTGSFPRGLSLMLRALTTWLYDKDPLKTLAFEDPLNQLKSDLKSNKRFFEELISKHFLQTNHRTTVILKPDSELAKKENDEEQKKLQAIKSKMTEDKIKAVKENTGKLQKMQSTPDTHEALATIPFLKLEDIERKNQLIPFELKEENGLKIICHDIPTSGIFYTDIGFNLHLLPQKYLPYVPLFGRALLEMGTRKEDFVSLSQRISHKTGGIKTGQFASCIKDSKEAAVWLLLRAKSTMERVPDLFEILSDILITAEFDNKQRFKQILLQEKAKQEQKIIPGGHLIVNSRIRSHLNESDWAMEKMTGLSYFYFLKELENIIDSDWTTIHASLEEIRLILLNRSSMVINITSDNNRPDLKNQVMLFSKLLPEKESKKVTWSPEELTESEGMIIPAQVNYVGKGSDLYHLGYNYHGSIHVITHFLRTTWLWEQVRVLGGAYGALCRFDKFSGAFSLVSYRDPNLLDTLNTFDRTARFLADLELGKEELTKSIIGAIGEIDGYMFPDTMGLVSMQRYLNGATDASRQIMRDQILATTLDDFKSFADILNSFKEKSIVKVLGSESSINSANKNKKDFLKTFSVL